MPVLFKQDNRLHAENFKLRTQLNKIQSEGYLGSLISLHAEEIAKKDRRIAQIEKKNAKLSEQHSSDLKRIRSLEFDLSIAELDAADLKVQMEHQMQISCKDLSERDGIIQKLKAQINRDYTNSSIPSSLCMGHETIHNGREKTGRKPGGQPGHQGHHRKKQIPSSQVNLSIPCACLFCSSDNLHTTGRSKTRQLIDLKVTVSATDYISKEFKCDKCGTSFYTEFPEGLPNEVNYGPEIKALSVFLNNRCNVSLDKTAETLWEMSDGLISISKGTLSNLSTEFSNRASSSLNEIIKDLRQSPVIHTDATNARVSGKNAHIYVYANKNGKVYSANAHKGIAALTGSPIDDYGGIIVHDHDRSFYRFGADHQECNVHVLRYLLDAAENEPHLKWHIQMRKLLLDMNRDRKVLLAAGETSFAEEALLEYRHKYDEILSESSKEYSTHPPTKYYINGFNLAARLGKYKKNHLLFLENFLVPFDNNLSERSLRVAKGKTKVAGTFRSMKDGLQRYCDFLSISETSKCKGSPVYQTIRNIFSDEDDIWSPLRK